MPQFIGLGEHGAREILLRDGAGSLQRAVGERCR